MLRVWRTCGVLALSPFGTGLVLGEAEKLKNDAYPSDRSLVTMRLRGAFNDWKVDIPGLGEFPGGDGVAA